MKIHTDGFGPQDAFEVLLADCMRIELFPREMQVMGYAAGWRDTLNRMATRRGLKITITVEPIEHERIYAAIYTNKDGSLGIRTASSLKTIIELMPTPKNEAFIFHLSNDVAHNIRKWNKEIAIWQDYCGP
jgi:hypothetical protein